MKLLNLWPAPRSSVAPRQQFIREWLVVLCLVVSLLLMGLGWVQWQQYQAQRTLAVLKSALGGLRDARGLGGAQVDVTRAVRARLAGRLDWMNDLPRWLVSGQVQWIFAHYDELGLTLEGIAEDEQAIELLLTEIQLLYPGQAVQVSELKHTRAEGRAVWQFRLRLDAVILSHRAPAGLGASLVENKSTPQPVVHEGSKSEVRP